MPCAIDAIAGPDMDAQFEDAFAHRFAVPEVAERQMVEPHPDACLRLQIAQAVQPFGEGLPPVLAPVSQQVNHIALLYLKSYPLSHLFRAALIPSISTGSVAERPGQLQPCPPPRPYVPLHRALQPRSSTVRYLRQ